MKRGWAAVALLAAALVICGLEYAYIGLNTPVYLDMLNSADEYMEKNDVYAAMETAERLDNRFINDSKIYDLFLFHGDVLDIQASLAALRRFAQTGEASEFLATSARVKRILMSLHNTRLPRMENIF